MVHNLAPVLNEEAGYAHWPILPQYPTLKPYVELLLDAPEFFTMFWNSCKQVFPIVVGQIVIGAPAAWAFARFRFRGKGVLYALSGTDEYRLGDNPARRCFHFSRFPYDPFFCGHTIGADGGRILRWSRSLADFYPSGASPWCAWYSFSGGFGIFRILECVGAAHDIFVWPEISGSGDCGFRNEGLGSLFYGKYIIDIRTGK